MIRQMRFKKWVEQYKDMVYSHAYHFTGNPADAADITQETFLRLWSYIDAISGRTVRNWLLKVAHNKCIDLSRKIRETRMPIYAQRDGSEQEVEFYDKDSSTPEDETLLSEMRHMVRQAILKLPPGVRVCIMMRELQQMSYSEIAQSLDMPLNTVKANIHRGRGILRRLLQRRQISGGIGDEVQ